MKPYIIILGRPVATYTIMAAIGALISIPLFSTLLKNKGVLRCYSRGLLWSILGIIIGAKTFSIISVGLTILISHKNFNISYVYTKTGIVYYGGLLGLIASYYLYCQIYKHSFDKIANELAICIPLFHFFGRIGCYLTGCCYGRVWDGYFSLLYNNGENIQKRIPTQLVEATFELLMFVCMFTLYKIGKHDAQKPLLTYYLTMYAVFRFIIEFFRGDTIRGVYGYFSFSQYISILIIIMILYKARDRLIRKRKTGV